MEDVKKAIKEKRVCNNYLSAMPCTVLMAIFYSWLRCLELEQLVWCVQLIKCNF